MELIVFVMGVFTGACIGVAGYRWALKRYPAQLDALADKVRR